MIHERFRQDYLPYVLEQVTQQKREQVESAIEERLKTEMQSLKGSMKKSDEEIAKLNKQIEALNVEMKSYYDKETIDKKY